jgi:hypothetical protein
VTGPYDDIINLPHHVSATRPRMSRENRAAQFSPFAALTGHEAAVAETARYTGEKIELGEEAIAELDMKLSILAENMNSRPEVSITHFRPDMKKNGGTYVTTTGTVKRIDSYEHTIALDSGEAVKITDILSIESDLFNSF